MNKNFLITITSVLIMSNHASAISLKESVAKSLEYNNELKAFKSALSSSKAHRLGAYLDLLPKINSTITKSRVDIKNKTANTSFDTINVSRGANITANIFNGGASLASIKLSTLNSKISELSFNKVHQSVILKASTAHLNYMLAEEAFKLSENEYSVLKKHYDSTKLRFDLGELTKTDVAQAEARLALSETHKIQKLGEFEVAKSQYLHVVGILPENLEKPNAATKSIPNNLDEAISIGAKNNKDVFMAYINSKAAAQNLKISISKLLPSVDLIASITKTHPSLTANNRLDKTIALQASIPIFQGGTEYTNISSSSYDKEKAKFLHLQAIDKMNTDIQTAWTQLNTTRATLDSSKSAENAAKMALEGVTEEAKIGLKTTLDVLNAEQEFYNNRLNSLNANYQHIINGYQLLAVIGKLDTDSF